MRFFFVHYLNCLDKSCELLIVGSSELTSQFGLNEQQETAQNLKKDELEKVFIVISNFDASCNFCHFCDCAPCLRKQSYS